MIYHQKRLNELAPVYDYCASGRCLAPEADRRNGCPACPVTLSWERFKAHYTRFLERDTLRDITEEGTGGEEAERELKRRLAEPPAFVEVMDSITAALELEQFAGEDEVSPKWNVRTAEVIRIIRQERANVRRETLYNIREDAKDRERSRNLGTGGGWRGEPE